jgi:hypothetical protein
MGKPAWLLRNVQHFHFKAFPLEMLLQLHSGIFAQQQDSVLAVPTRLDANRGAGHDRQAEIER